MNNIDVFLLVYEFYWRAWEGERCVELEKSFLQFLMLLIGCLHIFAAGASKRKCSSHASLCIKDKPGYQHCTTTVLKCNCCLFITSSNFSTLRQHQNFLEVLVLETKRNVKMFIHFVFGLICRAPISLQIWSEEPLVQTLNRLSYFIVNLGPLPPPLPQLISLLYCCIQPRSCSFEIVVIPPKSQMG